jgi:formate dehydrogenase maturation protein FdhE
LKCKECTSDKLVVFINDEDELVMAVTCMVCGSVTEYFDLDEQRRKELIESVTGNTAVVVM